MVVELPMSNLCQTSCRSRCVLKFVAGSPELGLARANTIARAVFAHRWLQQAKSVLRSSPASYSEALLVRVSGV